MSLCSDLNSAFALRLHDFHPNGKQDLLIDTMKQVKYAGVPWEVVFEQKVSGGVFISW